MGFKLMLLISIFVYLSATVFSQSLPVDSGRTISEADTIIIKPNEQQIHTSNGQILIYSKPKAFAFITNLPKDAAGIAATPFRKKSLKPLLVVIGSTGLLLLADQGIVDGVRQFSDNIHLHPEEEYIDLLNIKLGSEEVSLFKAPKNINTAIYQFGQGFPSLLIGAGLFTYGKIQKNYRALSTASQLAESFILMGVGTQILKRITGRQSPSEATTPGGKWKFFPSFKEYQNYTPNYDAFPSGHLATLMSTVTTLTENYPGKKWIKPVGYSVIALVGFSMLNNEVHWASDYPLALALGYVCAKQVARKNMKVIKSSPTRKQKTEMSYTFHYIQGKLMPGLVYKF